ncbi:hypothetical protein FJZ31_09375 [Candidatus Poribacteria bacterium]|nr:hypothetical protein [Candidatus Poribacteria bacterium]
MQKLLGERYFLLEEQVLSVWAFLTGLDLNLSVSSQFKKKHQLSDNLLEKFYPSISLSLDKVKIALDSILSILVNLNVRIIPKKKVSQLERFDSYWLIRCEDNFWFTSSYVVLATGKEGTYFLQQHIEQFQLSSFRRGLEIGARLEFPIHSMTFQGTSHDRKILWKPSSFSGEEVRTFCWTFPGKSILCRYGDLYCIDGLEDSSSDFWSFGLMVRQKEISAEERRRNVDELTKRQHSIFKGMPVAQKLDSFLQRESNIGEPDCSLQHFIQGNVEDLLGQTISSRLRETIFVLMEHQIIPKIISGCTIIAPCLGVWSDILHLNDDLETSAPNLFAVGDCVGSYRGSFQASLAGWVVGESIAQKIKCQNH